MRITLVSFLSFIFCYYCIYLSIQISVVSATCLVDQQSLLLQLKNSLMFKPENSTKLKLWNQNIECCNWSGVTCDREGHVVGLDLSEESISGGFDNSSSLFSLQHLQKLNLAANNFSSVIPSGFNKLVMLTYLNLSYANFVGQIPVEISQLTRLVTLDISSPSSYILGQGLKLENPNLQNLVQNLTSIRQLYLDGVIITAKGHEWSKALLPLRGLEELTMSNCNLRGPLDSSLSRLENLSMIILDGNNFSSSVPETFSSFRNLITLSLSSCGLTGTFPKKIFQMGTLSIIDLTFNNNLYGSFPEFPFNGSLETLRVSKTSFSGAFPYTIGNMRHLSELDLSNSKFNGALPISLSSLTQLRYMDLSSNSFTGPVPSLGMTKNLIHLDLSHNRLSGPIPTSSHFEGMHNLVSIDLRYNSINGSIPSSLFKLALLQKIRLSFNRFSKFDEFNNVSSTVINTLDLSSNNLSGPFPKPIIKLHSLSVLDLSSNRLNGLLQLDELLELRNLTALDLSYNNISIDVNVANDHTFLPNISTLTLASCNLKTFPTFLRNKPKLTILDLSNNQIHGKVPNWIWKLQNLQSFNVSHNMLTGLERPLENLTSNLIALDLHNNQLEGPIPVFPKFASYLDYSMNKFDSVIQQDIGNYLTFTIFLSLSNNSLQGSIPNSLCNASNLQVLDISINNISGTIPSCLMNMTQTLVVLNLRMNNLIGTIPDVFPPSCALRTLDLQKNNLDGQIPKSLVKCSALEVLDLASNNFTGEFPCLFKNISTIRVIVLRKNKFYGPIGCPKTNGTWHMLQIVDLAFNNFSGKLPGKCFTTWEAMKPDENQADSKVKHVQFQVLQFGQIYYHDSVTVTSKGQQLEFVKILTVFTAIDFSSNHFEGEIPKQLFDFKGLYILNLSNNALSGQIPSSIGNLKQLESLDLSKNSLEGEIPKGITSLSFLSFMNVSFNKLSGIIPEGTQIQSFPETSFIGNEKLCGPPSTNKCIRENPSAPTKESVMKFDWQYISSGVGFGVGAGLVFAPLMIWERGRKWSNDIIDKILMVVFPLFGLVYTPIGDDEDDTKEDSNVTEDSDYNEEEDYWSNPRLYCVFCSKFDNNKKKVIHDPNCTCFHSSAGSDSTNYSDSYSS